ncbi:hypothetical protein BIW11_07489 [Tropilaelaps mercedesae]|uniref:Uncharacterized protein n=1 Tax=Tropilaelaps mercedesae TaxID=418985 RepID=A0A1V9XU35_9ACAR|nr:hypothetical protein BIW11_07489 [Tropilaelaps mercedesae]
MLAAFVRIMANRYIGVGYHFHSIVLLLLLLYSNHFTTNWDCICIVMYVEFTAVFLDFYCLLFHSGFSIALILICINMLFRILALLALFKEFTLRGGTDIYASLFGMPRGSYDDLERPHLSVPPTTSDYIKGRNNMELPR